MYGARSLYDYCKKGANILASLQNEMSFYKILTGFFHYNLICINIARNLHSFCKNHANQGSCSEMSLFLQVS